MEHDALIKEHILTFNEKWFQERKELFPKHPSYNSARNILVEEHERWVDMGPHDEGYPEKYEYTRTLDEFYWYPDIIGEYDEIPEIVRPLLETSGSRIFGQIEKILSEGIEVLIKQETSLRNFILGRIEFIRKLKNPGFKHPFQNERDKLIESGINNILLRFHEPLKFNTLPPSSYDHSLKFAKNQATIIRLLFLLDRANYFKDDFVIVKHYVATQFRYGDIDLEFPFINFNKFRDEQEKMNEDKNYIRFYTDMITDFQKAITKLLE